MLTSYFYRPSLLSHAAALVLSLVVATATVAEAAVRLGVDVVASDGFDALAGKRIGLITNQTGVNSDGVRTRVILKKAPGVRLVSLFAPEHGIDGLAKAGRHVPHQVDPLTGLKVWSLYGPTRKPTPEMLKGLDALVFDMQDIGARSYTYVSTMGRAMEAAGEAGIEFIVLDRPNPLGGNRVEGPGIEAKWISFVGQFPVPYVHGLTAGELARMVNDRGWISHRCRLSVVPMKGWSRGMTWRDTGLRWVRTSPNIPYAVSPAYYVATGIIGSMGSCGFTVATGTDEPFQVFAAKHLSASAFTARMRSYGLRGVEFSPYASGGFSGVRIALTEKSPANLTSINVYLLSEAERAASTNLFTRYRDPDSLFWKIYGSTEIKSLIDKRTPPGRIVEGWDSGVARFRADRERYLLY